MKKNNCFAESDLLEKYKDVFFNFDTSVTYTMCGANLEYKKRRNEVLCLLSMPPKFDGVDNILL